MKTAKRKLSDLRAGAPECDIFVCSASYEDRCRSVADHLDVTQVGKALIARNEDHGSIIDGNFNHLKCLFADRGETVTLNTCDPLRSADAILEGVQRHCNGPAKKWLIDITTFTHEGALILFHVLAEHVRSTDSVEFIYSRAKEYSIGDKPEDKWLSKGIRDVRSVLGFAGELLPSRRSHLIVLAGFEIDRAISLIQEYEPTLISVGYGDPSDEGTQGHQQTNEAVVKKLRHLIGQIREFTFPCYDAVRTSIAIKNQVEQAYNTVIAPMNTKISTLGAACFCLDNPAVQICYGQANVYNHRAYSEPGDECYQFSLDAIPMKRESL